jgi:hypothetical protein
VDFDTTTGEMRTASRVVGEGEFGEFAFTGLHVVTNQTERRVELLEIDRGERMVLKPSRMRSGERRRRTGARPRPGTDEGGPVADATNPTPAAPAKHAARGESERQQSSRPLPPRRWTRSSTPPRSART